LLEQAHNTLSPLTNHDVVGDAAYAAFTTLTTEILIQARDHATLLDLAKTILTEIPQSLRKVALEHLDEAADAIQALTAVDALKDLATPALEILRPTPAAPVVAPPVTAQQDPSDSTVTRILAPVLQGTQATDPQQGGTEALFDPAEGDQTQIANVPDVSPTPPVQDMSQLVLQDLMIAIAQDKPGAMDNAVERWHSEEEADRLTMDKLYIGLANDKAEVIIGVIKFIAHLTPFNDIGPSKLEQLMSLYLNPETPTKAEQHIIEFMATALNIDQSTLTIIEGLKKGKITLSLITQNLSCTNQLKTQLAAVQADLETAQSQAANLSKQLAEAKANSFETIMAKYQQEIRALRQKNQQHLQQLSTFGEQESRLTSEIEEANILIDESQIDSLSTAQARLDDRIAQKQTALDLEKEARIQGLEDEYEPILGKMQERLDKEQLDIQHLTAEISSLEQAKERQTLSFSDGQRLLTSKALLPLVKTRIGLLKKEIEAKKAELEQKIQELEQHFSESKNQQLDLLYKERSVLVDSIARVRVYLGKLQAKLKTAQNQIREIRATFKELEERRIQLITAIREEDERRSQTSMDQSQELLALTDEVDGITIGELP